MSVVYTVNQLAQSCCVNVDATTHTRAHWSKHDKENVGLCIKNMIDKTQSDRAMLRHRHRFLRTFIVIIVLGSNTVAVSLRVIVCQYNTNSDRGHQNYHRWIKFILFCILSFSNNLFYVTVLFSVFFWCKSLSFF